MFILSFVNYLISLYNYIQGDDVNVKLKNKVVDFVTPTEACRIIGISEKSTPQITRWMNEGKIQGVLSFGNNKAIPISWVKSECNTRGINWEGVELKEGEISVSLKDYIPIADVYNNDKKTLNKIYMRMKRGTFQDDYIRFGNAYGIRK